MIAQMFYAQDILYYEVYNYTPQANALTIRLRHHQLEYKLVTSLYLLLCTSAKGSAHMNIAATHSNVISRLIKAQI
jgi:hypothetical protein